MTTIPPIGNTEGCFSGEPDCIPLPQQSVTNSGMAPQRAMPISCKKSKMNKDSSYGSPLLDRFMAALFFLGVVVLVWLGLPYQPSKADQDRYERDPFLRRLPVLLEDTERRNGLVYLRDQHAPFEGEVIERYRNGTLKSATKFVAGRVHGWSAGYYTNGQLQVREPFINGVSHGTRTKWHPDGSTQSVARIVGGQLNGPFHRWHENGQLAQEVFLTNGVAHGPSRAWHADGRLTAEVRVQFGKVIEQRFWSADGEILKKE